MRRRITIFERILAATDFGSASERAVDFAVDCALRYGAKLDLVHVFHAPRLSSLLAAQSLDEMSALQRKALEAELARARARDPSAEATWLKGEPVARLLG